VKRRFRELQHIDRPLYQHRPVESVQYVFAFLLVLALLLS
jgi:hypothetical protein